VHWKAGTGFRDTQLHEMNTVMGGPGACVAGHAEDLALNLLGLARPLLGESWLLGVAHDIAKAAPHGLGSGQEWAT